MIFTEIPLRGNYEIELERSIDERGFFARIWCAREFEEHGLSSAFVQANLSSNQRKGTLRGMHLQAEPHQEAKLIRCVQGAIYCVLLDLRPDSLTFCKWHSFELTAENYKSLFIAKGMATGFLTLQDRTEVLYQMSEVFVPGAGRGFRYDDPAFGIHWPAPVKVISEKDRNWPDYTPESSSLLLSAEQTR